LTTPVQAAPDSRMDLILSKSKIKVGDSVTADVLVKSAPDIYGADVRLVFDPTFLQVVDQDDKVPGIQVVDGNFISPKKSFFLQNQVLNDQGAVDYALTLLNPAPEVNGSGQLVSVVFEAIKSGETTLQLSEGQFGTRTGEVISPVLGSADLQIRGSQKGLASILSGDLTNEMQSGAVKLPVGMSVPVSTVTGLGGVGILGLGLALIWQKFRRSPRN